MRGRERRGGRGEEGREEKGRGEKGRGGKGGKNDLTHPCHKFLATSTAAACSF